LACAKSRSILENTSSTFAVKKEAGIDSGRLGRFRYLDELCSPIGGLSPRPWSRGEEETPW
jgi:hypothetical protein